MVFYALILLYQHFTPQRIAFATENLVNSVPQASKAAPQTVYISRLGIRLNVYEGSIKGSKWEVSSKGITHLSGTPFPGEAGNSVFYGHNWTSLLGKLPDVIPGDLIEVEFDGGVNKSFVVNYIFEVSPNDSSIIEKTKNPQLTIYTCSGFLDTKRFVVVAFPVNLRVK